MEINDYTYGWEIIGDRSSGRYYSKNNIHRIPEKCIYMNEANKCTSYIDTYKYRHNEILVVKHFAMKFITRLKNIQYNGRVISIYGKKFLKCVHIEF